MKRGPKPYADRADAREDVLCFRLTTPEMEAIKAAARASKQKPAQWARETLVRLAQSIVMRAE